MNHSEFPGCPFCPANGKVDILAEANGMYVVRAKNESLVDLPDRFLIVPVEHVEVPEHLPLGWGETLIELTRTVDLLDNFNWSMNIGAGAGQTREHLHWWGLDRTTDSIGKGMSWMIQHITQVEEENSRLQHELDHLRPKRMDALLLS